MMRPYRWQVRMSHVVLLCGLVSIIGCARSPSDEELIKMLADHRDGFLRATDFLKNEGVACAKRSGWKAKMTDRGWRGWNELNVSDASALSSIRATIVESGIKKICYEKSGERMITVFYVHSRGFLVGGNGTSIVHVESDEGSLATPAPPDLVPIGRDFFLWRSVE